MELVDTRVVSTATFVKDLEGWRGDASLFRLNPPLSDEPYDEDVIPTHYEYVIVSGVDALFTGPETYIFPADSNGDAVSMLELPGSFRGAIDQEQALHGAGYEIINYPK